MTCYGKRLPGKPGLLAEDGATPPLDSTVTHKCENAQNLGHMHIAAHSSPFGFFYLKGDCSCSAAGNLFYLNGTSMCLSPAHLLTWYSSQTELSPHGMRGEKIEKLPAHDKALTHSFTIQ